MFQKYDKVVLIGRFQLPHTFHLSLIEKALIMGEKVIIIIGSSYLPRTPKNPFFETEREEMIKAMISNSLDRSRIIFEYETDTHYDNTAWASSVVARVSKYTSETDRIALIGHKKDNDTSTFYLDMFPQWDFINEPCSKPSVNASDIRKMYFNPDVNMKFLEGVVHPETIRFLTKFKETVEYKELVEYSQFIEKYRTPYKALPYEPIFVTTDAVVIQSGHVLMIKRKAQPGRGLWALPGGFVNATTDASVLDAAIRELKEETGIKVPEKVLLGCIEDEKVFDAIDRSERGRTITHAYKFVLSSDSGKLPRVKGSDDADKAKWIPLSKIKSRECFDDHFQIIQYFAGSAVNPTV